MRLVGLTFLLTAPWVIAAPALKERPKTDPIVGTWAWVTSEEGGVTRPARAGLRWEFMPDGRRIVTRIDGSPLESRYTTDPTSAPMTIDIRFDGGGIHGIYKVDGDTLTMAVVSPGVQRPVTFITKPDDRAAVYVFRRVKAD